MADSGKKRARRRSAAAPPVPAPSLKYAAVLGLKPADAVALVAYVQRGLSWAAFERLQHATDFTARQIADAVGIPGRTLHRRKVAGRLAVDESDKLVRLSRVYGRTLELFEGDQAEAKRWLSSPAPALGGAAPLSMAGTDVGAREVEALIGRLEHGVIS
jgi:putative toxin-antitoxin system antitoxin component (TIGR02293 family)